MAKLKKSINNKSSKRVVGTIRRTQLITTFGIGAIVDLPNDSVIVAGTDYWTNSDDSESIIHEESLQNLLGVDYFVKPKIETNVVNNKFEKSKDIPVFRFPKMLICTKCQKIAEYNKFSEQRSKRVCSCSKNSELIPSRFIIGCENGHIEDFPYSWWVHYGNEEGCSRPNDLIIFNDKKSGGLESIKIKCNGCGKIRSMDNAFSKNALSGYKCKGNRPWLDDNDTEVCDKEVRTLQRGASNVYFGSNVSALSIPPWSSKIQEAISKDWKNIYKHIAGDKPVLKMLLNANKLHERLNCTVSDIIKQIQLKAEKGNKTEPTPYEDIVQDEYRAFMSGNNDDINFKTEVVEVPELFEDYISKIVLVKRLKEVLVLKGFSRIKPLKGPEDEAARLAPISKSKKNWLPAIEMFGEGIFIQLNKEKLTQWENNVYERYKRLTENNTGEQPVVTKISARYILLHTLAHLIIRQLTLDCGYSSSALKERIYSTYSNYDNGIDMEGILIYTSTSDSEGSLGGLVRQGETNNIDRVLRKLIEDATWCSSDPLCIQSTAQGLDSLNFAACHSCTLLPETCCESRNTYLDRGALVGSLDDKTLGYFQELLEEE